MLFVCASSCRKTGAHFSGSGSWAATGARLAASASMARKARIDVLDAGVNVKEVTGAVVSVARRPRFDARADYVIRRAPALRVQPAAPTASQLRSREPHGAGGIVEIELCCLTAGAERAGRASDIDDCAIDGRYRTRNGDTGRRDWI